MNFKATVQKFIYNETEEEQEQVYEGPRLVKNGHLNIMVRSPKSFGDVREYADALMEGSAIMVCFDAVDATLKNRIFDYLNGVSYIVGASISRVSDDLLMYAPKQVTVSRGPVKKSSSWLD